jgi:hypothetical protein
MSGSSDEPFSEAYEGMGASVPVSVVKSLHPLETEIGESG